MGKFLDKLYISRIKIRNGILIYQLVLIVLGALFSKIPTEEYFILLIESFLFNLLVSILIYGFYCLFYKFKMPNRFDRFYNSCLIICATFCLLLAILNFIIYGEFEATLVGAPMFLYTFILERRFVWVN